MVKAPVVAFRVDMDSNDVIEAKEDNHVPTKGGFRSCHDKAMHACGHDAHMTMGLVLPNTWLRTRMNSKALSNSSSKPAEEGVRGAKAMAEAGVVDDVDLMFGMHG